MDNSIIYLAEKQWNERRTFFLCSKCHRRGGNPRQEKCLGCGAMFYAEEAERQWNTRHTYFLCSRCHRRGDSIKLMDCRGCGAVFRSEEGEESWLLSRSQLSTVPKKPKKPVAAPPSVLPSHLPSQTPEASGTQRSELWWAIAGVALKAGFSLAATYVVAAFILPFVLGLNRGIALGTYRDRAGISAVVLRGDGTCTLDNYVDCSRAHGRYRVANHQLLFDSADDAGGNAKVANHPMTAAMQSLLAGDISSSKDAFSVLGSPYTRMSSDTADAPMPCSPN